MKYYSEIALLLYTNKCCISVVDEVTPLEVGRNIKTF